MRVCVLLVGGLFRMKGCRVKTYLYTICSHQWNYRRKSIRIHGVTDGSLVTHLFRLSAEQVRAFPTWAIR